jgi:hypothetical protein
VGAAELGGVRCPGGYFIFSWLIHRGSESQPGAAGFRANTHRASGMTPGFIR